MVNGIAVFSVTTILNLANRKNMMALTSIRAKRDPEKSYVLKVL